MLNHATYNLTLLCDLGFVIVWVVAKAMSTHVGLFMMQAGSRSSGNNGASGGGGRGVSRPPGPPTEVLIWVGVLIVVVIVGGLILMYMNKRMSRPDREVSSATVMEQLRTMRDTGAMSQAEYDAARLATARRIAPEFGAKADVSTNRKPDRKPDRNIDPRGSSSDGQINPFLYGGVVGGHGSGVGRGDGGNQTPAGSHWNPKHPPSPKSQSGHGQSGHGQSHGGSHGYSHDGGSVDGGSGGGDGGGAD